MEQLTEKQLALIDKMVNEAWYNGLGKQVADEVSQATKNAYPNAKKFVRRVGDHVKGLFGDEAANERIARRQAQNPNDFLTQLKYLWDKKYNNGRLAKYDNERMNRQMEKDMAGQNVNMKGGFRQMWEGRCFDYWCQTYKGDFVYDRPYEKHNGQWGNRPRNGNKTPGDIAAAQWTNYMRRACRNPRYANPKLADYIKNNIDVDPYCLRNLSYADFMATTAHNKRKRKRKPNNNNTTATH